MPLAPNPTIGSLPVPGAHLHYEVRGTGPLLMVIGSPMPSADFAPVADALARDHTVVTYDPRGLAASTIDDPEQDATPDLRADDVAALIDALGADSADVFGSSGGAATGLALVTRHPARVRTLVAHEPPLLDLLPDAGQQRADMDDVIETFHRDGHLAAWMKFMIHAGFDPAAFAGGDGQGTPVRAEPTEKDVADAGRFFDHELLHTARYLPDVAALTAGPARVVVGNGAGSGHLVTHRTSTALAGLLGSAPAEFPGDHGGFMAAPMEFADVLRKFLTD
jgi:pimeloyl-ACP methyl ester carboxylesterase